MEEVHRRRALQLEKKRSTHNPKRGSTSFPILPHDPSRKARNWNLLWNLLWNPHSPIWKRHRRRVTSHNENTHYSIATAQRKNIYEQLKELEEKKGDRNLRELFNTKTLEEDEFLQSESRTQKVDSLIVILLMQAERIFNQPIEYCSLSELLLLLPRRSGSIRLPSRGKLRQSFSCIRHFIPNRFGGSIACAIPWGRRKDELDQ